MGRPVILLKSRRRRNGQRISSTFVPGSTQVNGYGIPEIHLDRICFRITAGIRDHAIILSGNFHFEGIIRRSILPLVLIIFSLGSQRDGVSDTKRRVPAQIEIDQCGRHGYHDRITEWRTGEGFFREDLIGSRRFENQPGLAAVFENGFNISNIIGPFHRIRTGGILMRNKLKGIFQITNANSAPRVSGMNRAAHSPDKL